MAGDRREPGAEAATIRVELPGTPPQLKKDVLDRFLGFGRAERPRRKGIDKTDIPIVEQLERGNVARGDAGGERRVRQQIGPLVILRLR